jgi:hypothetical protein
MSENVIQTSFSAGELAPNMFARVDFAKYKAGCATLRNFFVDYRSGASTRPGTEYIRPCGLGSAKVRLVKFQQSVSVTYILEFGQGYIRFISNGASVVEAPFAITNITKGSLTQVFGNHNFGNHNLIFITGVAGMPEVNNRYYLAESVVPGVSYYLFDPHFDQPIDSTNWVGTYGGGGFTQRVYTVATPYQESELALLKFSQNASVMNITHNAHPPATLTLFSATNWVLATITVGSSIIGPSIQTITPTPNPIGPVAYKYIATAVDGNNQESVPGNPGIYTGAPDMRVTQSTNYVTWNAVAGADSYNLYASSPTYALGSVVFDSGGVGLIANLPGNVLAFSDSNIGPDFAQTPPVHEDPFIITGVYPGVSSYFQQRLCYANAGGQYVSTFWMSKVGSPYNFDVSNPSQANDAITGALVSLEVNEIKSLVPMPTGLVMLTTHGAWQVNGGQGGIATQGGPITPITATASPQAYIGANDVPPIVINYDIIFVQQKGSIIRDLTVNIYANIYTGNDISILSSHLFYDHQILEWSYAEEPFKIVWAVRNDGTLLSLTLVKEQDMYGWARHDTLGEFMSVASVIEGELDATYVVVQRPSQIAGGDRLVIERLANRQFPVGAEDAWCVDSGVALPQSFPNGILIIGKFLGNPDLVPLFNNAGTFTVGMIGWIIRAGGGILELTQVSNGNSAQAKVLQPIKDVFPNDPQGRYKNVPAGEWSLDKPVTKVFGLDHLEGQAVSVLADGGVIHDMVVHGGSITLPAPATKVVVGLGFQAQLQTMPLDLGNEANTVQGKRKKVAALTVRVKDSRGVKAGRTFDTVTPIKELNRTTMMGFPIPLITADERIIMDPLWDVPGQICIQVDDPLPSTVLGVIPEVIIGDGQK